MKNDAKKNEIVEKQLGIPPDYQYKALHNSSFLQSNWHANKLEALDFCLDFNRKVCVLDLGAGSGNFEMLYGNRVKHITAVDYHQEALDFLKSKLADYNVKNITLIHSDIRELHKVKQLETYDLVLMVDVIEHIKLADASNLVAFFKKIVNPNGSVCIITPNYHSLWLYIERILDKFTIVPHFDGLQHLAQYYPENLREVFEKHGFTTTKITSFNLFSFISPFKSLSTFLCKLELASNMRFGNLLLGVFKNEKK